MDAIIQINPADPAPLYVQIANGIKAHIASGRLAARDALPGLRDLAQDLEVNLNTVKAAYELLAGLGLVYLRRGSRARVRRPPVSVAAQQDLRRALGRLFVDARLAGLDRKDFVRLCDEAAKEGLK